MTALREQTIDMLKQLPENKVAYVMRLLQEMLVKEAAKEDCEPTRSQVAYQRLQNYRRNSIEDFDYKEELAKVLEEKCVTPDEFLNKRDSK